MNKRVCVKCMYVYEECSVQRAVADEWKQIIVIVDCCCWFSYALNQFPEVPALAQGEAMRKPNWSGDSQGA